LHTGAMNQSISSALAVRSLRSHARLDSGTHRKATEVGRYATPNVSKDEEQ